MTCSNHPCTSRARSCARHEHPHRRRDGPDHGDRARHAGRRDRAPVTVGHPEPRPRNLALNLHDGTDSRAQYGRVAGMTDHNEVLRYAAGICAAGYQPGTIERGLLEQFAAK